MPIPVLVQALGIAPPRKFGIRVVPARSESSEGRQSSGKVELQQSKDKGGCRTDQILYELSLANLKLVDVHLKYRGEAPKLTPLLNFGFDSAGKKFTPDALTYEEWSTHRHRTPREIGEWSAEDIERYWHDRYERWCEKLAEDFRIWYEDLFNRSWLAGRLYVNAELICVNLVGSLRLQPDDESFTLSKFLSINV